MHEERKEIEVVEESMGDWRKKALIVRTLRVKEYYTPSRYEATRPSSPPRVYFLDSVI